MAYEYLFKTPVAGRLALASSRWESIADAVACASPIDDLDIPHFFKWIDYNGFAPDHFGKDFAVYLNKWNESILGLPGNTPVHSILDGVVLHVHKVKVMEGVVDPYDGYLETVVVAHGVSPREDVPSLVGVYAHAKSTVKAGQFVQRGQKIAKLYRDHGGPWNRGRLVHLHLGLAHYDGETLTYEDPDVLFGNLMNLTALPQRETSFMIEERREQADVRLANFGTLLFQRGPNMRGDAPRSVIEYLARGAPEGVPRPRPLDTFSAPSPTYSIVERAKELFFS